MAEIRPVSEAMDEALARLQAGEVVAIPTETVYGLAGDATNGEAVARIFEAKGRPRFNPLIAHVDSMAMAESLRAFRPGLASPGGGVLAGPADPGAAASRRDSALHPLVTAGLDSVALRMPRGFGAALIARFGRPLAAPSANRSGRISTTTAQAVADDLGDRIGLVVDGGATAVGVESTIVKVDGDGLHLLRPGGIAGRGARGDRRHAGHPRRRRRPSRRPGMMASHYAPNAALRLNATEVRAGEALLAFGPWRAANVGQAVAYRNLSETGDLREAASNLFSHLHALDRSGARTIAVEPVPAYRPGRGDQRQAGARRRAA